MSRVTDPLLSSPGAPRSILIGHEGAILSRGGAARWPASLSDLLGIAALSDGTLLALILLAALGLRLYFAVCLPGSIEHGDMVEYNRLALNILHDGALPSPLRSPGYPAFVAGVYAIFGEKTLPILVIQAVVGVLGVLVMYQLGVDVLGERRRRLVLLAVALYAFSPGVAFYSRVLLREAWLTLLTPLAAWLALRVVQRSWRYAIPLGLTGCALAYVRMEGGLLVAVILVLGLLRAGYRRRALCGGLLASAIVIIGAAPWVAHCARTRGYASMQDSARPNFFARTWYLSPEGKVEPELRRHIAALVEQNDLTPVERRSWIVPELLLQELPPGDIAAQVELHRRLGAIARENLSRNPLGYLKSFPLQTWKMMAGEPFSWWNENWSPSLSIILRARLWHHLALRLFHFAVWPAVVVPLVVVAWLWSVRRGDSSCWSLTALLLAATAIILAIMAVNSHGEPRLRVPYDSILYLAAVLGGAVLLRKVKPMPPGARESS